MIELGTFESVVDALRAAGYADADIEWSENCGPPTSAEAFARETIFVICNSGMKSTVARGIFERVCGAIARGESVRTVFNHPGKAQAIDDIWARRQEYFTGFLAAADVLEYCASIPWIGGITKYHLAKNFGAQVAKPDVHLQRLAALENTTPQALCERLAQESGFKVATVDVLLWRACAVGIIDSRTGAIHAPLQRAATN
ncbi:MAG: hypothetical protein ACYCV6_01790 [Steroidobacteraceae bacterium]|jgi:hypothetical protein